MSRTDWKRIPVYMMDFEGSAASGVVEYGVVRLVAGQVDATWTGLCRPTGQVPKRDGDVHGLSAEDLRGCCPFASHYERFVQFRRDGIFAAHNRHAENSFLKRTWAIPPAVRDWEGAAESRTQTWGPWLDTLDIYRGLYPQLPGYGLSELIAAFRLAERLDAVVAQHCPETRRRPHCALYDALASALLLLRLEDEPRLRDTISLSWLLGHGALRHQQGDLFTS